MNDQSKNPTPEEFFSGFLSAVAITQPNLNAKRSQLHRAFYRALQNYAKNVFDIESMNIDYDPLYGQSRWFDRALTRAQRDLLVNFPNPSYDRIQIRLNKEESMQKLSALGREDNYIQLAQQFVKELQKSS